ncbi:DUF2807 domain-containing protein, partial [bacterium]|nr:DUF2807 domain-containing protein [bacterium]
MYKFAPLLAGVALLGALAKTGGCQVQTVVGSGVMQTVTFEIASFDAVRIGHTFFATIVHGEEASVVVTADDNIMERIVVTVSDSILRVDFGGPINLQNATLSVAITVPTLTDLRLSGASKAELDDISTDGKFFLGLSGASEVFGELRVESLRMALS